MNKLPLIAQDKANHAVYGNAIFAFGAVSGKLVGLPPLLCGGVLVSAFAVAKEIYDRITRLGTPDPMDAVWTVLGAVPSMIVCSMPIAWEAP